MFLLLLSCSGDGPPPDGPGDSDPFVDTQPPGPCEVLDLPVRPFEQGDANSDLNGLATDFSIALRDGTDWTLSEHWTGCDSYLFIQDEPAQARGWRVWDRDLEDFLDKLPKNTHVFFMSSQFSGSAREESLDQLQLDVGVWLEDQKKKDAEWWSDRLHYAKKQDIGVGGWIGDLNKKWGWAVGIDRFQRIRFVGSYADPERYNGTWFDPNLSMVANEPLAYNYEAQMRGSVEALGGLVVPVFTGETCSGSATVEVELPPSEELEAYDTLWMDAQMQCVGEGEYGSCPAWDYMAYVYRCSWPSQSENPYSSQACESGETLSGSCDTPQSTTQDGTYRCKEDLSGFEDLDCPCNTEVGRWITTYHREGRWQHDISAYLPLIDDGGPQRWRFQTSGPYEIKLSLRFADIGKEARPDEAWYLFDGGHTGIGYNENHEDITLTVPSDATQVFLATVITQHGADGNNCGEFCNIAHHFGVNGVETVHDFPESTTRWDCMDRVATDGTVPNQYGTWWYGRAGWCPGKQVPTVMTDVTAQVKLGEENVFSYNAYYGGVEYSGSANIRMRSWLIIAR